MLPRERRFWSVLLGLGLLALARGQYGLTNAYAVWSSAQWDNPDTIELEEINARASLTVQYVDPTEEARAYVIGALPELPYLALFAAADGAPASPARTSNIARAPPA